MKYQTNQASKISDNVLKTLEKAAEPLCVPDRVHDISPEGVAKALTDTLVDPHEAVITGAAAVIAGEPIKEVIPNLNVASLAPVALDPVTAGFDAAAALFNFLSTTQGQIVTADIIALDEFFVKKVQEVFTKIHDHLMKN
jgi:hypothetical protein